MKIQMARHFIKYAFGAYYIIELHSWQNLCQNCPRENYPSYLVDVNVCYCNLSTLEEICGLADQDVKLVSFSSGVYTLPLFIAVDHNYQGLARILYIQLGIQISVFLIAICIGFTSARGAICKSEKRIMVPVLFLSGLFYS